MRTVSSTEFALIRDLRAVAGKVHGAGDIGEVLSAIGQEVCGLFKADRLTIYLVSEDKTLIVSKIKTGLDTYEDLKLPISSEHSIAGYVARNKRLINIKDAYDVAELNAFDPPVYFLRDVDKSTGYRTIQVLAAPILGATGSNEVIGVVQVINTTSGKPFSRAAEEGIEEFCKALGAALTGEERTIWQRDKDRRATAKSKYQHLIVDGVITPTEMDLAINLARRKNVEVGRVLVSEFQVSVAALGNALSKHYGLPYEPYRADRVRPLALIKNLRREFVQVQGWVPIAGDKEGIVVVTINPELLVNSNIVNQVFPRKKISHRVCTPDEFAETLNHFYGSEDVSSSVDTIIKRIGLDVPAAQIEADDQKTEPDNATVQLVNKIVVEAHNMRASDIHIEPRQGKASTKVRFRIDGSLMEYIEFPASSHAQLVARLKVMANLDIANKREPQDGKINFKQFLPSPDVELRVATIPTAGGKEDVVMRILATGKPLPIEQLGLSAHNLEALKSLIVSPHGLFLVCGPTGSGKTTTLHSVLGYVDTPETKIWTAEDPVEITRESFRQVQINPRTDLTFARAMRAFLRADPDVIMVGEMRDRETAAIGIEASLTGHRVLATLHTNSAPESIVRLLDMGMDPFHFADALLGVMAQRLAKRLCPKCKKPRVTTQDEIRQILTEYCEALKATHRFVADPKAAEDAIFSHWSANYAYEKGRFILYEPAGCDACRGTGYRGRLALHELLVCTDAIKKNIQEHARTAEILFTALNEGMQTLKQDGILKVLQGHTNLQAVRAVCIV